MPKLAKLSPKEERFVLAYTEHWNGTRAVLEAGYAFTTYGARRTQAHALLHKPRIMVAVQKVREVKDSLLEDVVRRATDFLTLQVEADPRAMFDEAGAPLPIKSMADAEASLVAGFETDGATVIKMKLSDRRAAAEGILKHVADWRGRGARRGPVEVTVDPSKEQEEEADIVVRARRVAFALRLGVEAESKAGK